HCLSSLRRSSLIRPFMLIGLLWLAAPSVLVAQAPAPRQVSGVVTDQTGATIVGAEVGCDSGCSSAKLTTDDRGGFVVSQLASDSGVVKISAAGFQARTLDWRAGTHLKVVLLPASAAEQVTVTANRTGVRAVESATSVTILSAQDLQTTAAFRADECQREVRDLRSFPPPPSRA